MADPHTEKLKFERQLMQATGLTRGQIRKGIEARMEVDRRERERNLESRPVSETFRPVGTAQELKPALFDTSSRASGKAGQNVGSTEDYYVAINGTLYTQTFVVSGEPTEPE